MNLALVQTAVATRLPLFYEPLSITFYGLGSRQKGVYITFANDTGADLCVNSIDGRVSAATIEESNNQSPFSGVSGGNVRFVNSSLDQFISFFNTYVRSAEKIRKAWETKDKTYVDLVRSMRPALEAIDKDALGDDKWWEPAVEQLEEENL
jgi:hypothetical protein